MGMVKEDGEAGRRGNGMEWGGGREGGRGGGGEGTAWDGEGSFLVEVIVSKYTSPTPILLLLMFQFLHLPLLLFLFLLLSSPKFSTHAYWPSQLHASEACALCDLLLVFDIR